MGRGRLVKPMLVKSGAGQADTGHTCAGSDMHWSNRPRWSNLAVVGGEAVPGPPNRRPAREDMHWSMVGQRSNLAVVGGDAVPGHGAVHDGERVRRHLGRRGDASTADALTIMRTVRRRADRKRNGAVRAGERVRRHLGRGRRRGMHSDGWTDGCRPSFDQRKALGWTALGWTGGCGWMGGWVDVDGWMDGWMGGWIGGWVDGWVDGRKGKWADRQKGGWTGKWASEAPAPPSSLLSPLSSRDRRWVGG